MKKIIIFFPSIESAGVEKNFYYLVNYFSNKFEKITVITASNIKKKEFSKKISFLKPKSLFWSNKSRLIQSIVCFFLALKFLKKNILILSFQSNIFAIILSMILKSKIIIRLNTSPEKYIDSSIKKFFFSFFYKFSDEIIVNSFDFKKNFKRILKLNSQTIYNPIILTKKNKNKKIIFFNNFRYLKILSIGRLTDQKDQITLIRALNILKNEKLKFRLYLIGQGYNYNKISKYIESHNLKKNIKLAGFKKNAYNYMNSADLFILSSKYEGLPNVLLEAQYLGVPIISSNCPTGPKEILLNGKAGTLFKTGNHFELAKKIKFFVKRKSLFIKKVKFAKNFLYRFDNKIIKEKYYKILLKHLN